MITNIFNTKKSLLDINNNDVIEKINNNDIIDQSNIIEKINNNDTINNPLNFKLTTNKINETEYDLLLTIKSPEVEIDSYCDIILCIDTSSSMSSYATKKNLEQDFLTILDILKFSATVIIKSCNEKQRIGIVKFSNYGEVVKELTVLNDEGKEILINSINSLESNGQTNLYDGIIKSWQLFDSSNVTCNKKSIILFTDGEPNIDPLRGYSTELQRFKKNYCGDKYISDVNIFALGNGIDSILSNLISKETNGIYGFIPDSKSIGDLLIHKLAAIRTTIKKNIMVEIIFGEDIEITFNDTNIKKPNISQSINYTYTSKVLLINVGDILCGCDRNFVFKVKTKNVLNIKDHEFVNDNLLRITITDDNIIPTVNNIIPIINDDNNVLNDDNICILNNKNLLDITYNKLRQCGIETLMNIVDNLYNNYTTNKIFNEYIELLKLNIDSDKRIYNLHETFNDQVKIAFDDNFHDKWGKHYLLSLSRALQMEQCTNFLDLCVQHFGSKIFNNIVNIASDLFLEIQVIKPVKKPILKSTQQIFEERDDNISLCRNNYCYVELSETYYDNFIRDGGSIFKGASKGVSKGASKGVSKGASKDVSRGASKSSYLGEIYNNNFKCSIFNGVLKSSHSTEEISMTKSLSENNSLVTSSSENNDISEINNVPIYIDMNKYFNRGDKNVCFHGLSLVLMFDGSSKFVKDIKKYDSVMLGNNKEGIIECVIQTIITTPIEIIKLNDILHLTPYHPVKDIYTNHWCFPKDINNVTISNLECNEIYSFVLTEKSRSHLSGIIIGNYECATLGHNIEDDDCIKHPFFGTNLVINNLKQSTCYDDGFITLKQNCLIRCKVSNLIKEISINDNFNNI